MDIITGFEVSFEELIFILNEKSLNNDIIEYWTKNPISPWYLKLFKHYKYRNLNHYIKNYPGFDIKRLKIKEIVYENGYNYFDFNLLNLEQRKDCYIISDTRYWEEDMIELNNVESIKNVKKFKNQYYKMKILKYRKRLINVKISIDVINIITKYISLDITKKKIRTWVRIEEL